MSKNIFISEFMAKLDGKIKKEEMHDVMMELSIFLSDWEVERRCTAVAVHDDLPECYKAYMVTKKIEGRSDKTLNLYRIRLEHMLTTIKKPVEKISTNDLRIYLYTLQQERKISDRTLDGCRLVINGFFAWCSDEGYIMKNPCAAISPIKYEEAPRKPFTDEQMELIRVGCKDNRDKALIEVLYATGCRCHELAILKKEDVDLEKREVHLFGKGKKHRVAFLNAKAVVALRMYYRERADENPHVFVSQRRPHHGLSNEGIEKILKQIGDRAGVESVYPHRLRHTFATDALNHGMAVTELQALLGHAKVDTTMIYGKVNPEVVRSSYKKSIA